MCCLLVVFVCVRFVVFFVCLSLLCVGYVLFVGCCCLLVVVCCSACVVCCCLLFVLRGFMRFVCGLLIVDCCVLCFVCCLLLSVVCWLLVVVLCEV